MSKSSRLLGQEVGLTSQEMNYVLKKEGYLDGEPSDYIVTEKGESFAHEKDNSRGTGGYSQYNRSWTTRSWDESIVDELHITDELRTEARDAVAAQRRQKWEEIKTARAETDVIFQEKYNPIDINDDDDDDDDETNKEAWGALKILLLLGGLFALGVGVYKAAPHVTKWLKSKAAPKILGFFRSSDSAEIPEEVLCPVCGNGMKMDEAAGVWKCDKCDDQVLD